MLTNVRVCFSRFRLQDAPHAPFAPCRSIAGRPQSRMTDMNCGRRGRRLEARSSRPRAALQRRDFREAPARHLPFQTSGRPPSPFAPCRSIAGRSQSRATEMNFGLRWRCLGARASRPPARRRRAHPGHLHLQWEKGVAHRDRFFGKPLRAISHFKLQDAHPPPSPRVGALRGDRNRGRPK
jgi:hypothetical protein